MTRRQKLKKYDRMPRIICTCGSTRGAYDEFGEPFCVECQTHSVLQLDIPKQERHLVFSTRQQVHGYFVRSFLVADRDLKVKDSLTRNVKYFFTKKVLDILRIIW